MSGFEVAGVVLAILPFFIEAGKSYVDTFRKAVTRSARDEGLLDFYEDLYIEMYELRKHIETLVLELPGLSDERKQEVVDSRELDGWDQAGDVATALEDFLPSPDDYAAFHMVMEKVLDLLARLVKDETVHLSRSDKVYYMGFLCAQCSNAPRLHLRIDPTPLLKSPPRAHQH